MGRVIGQHTHLFERPAVREDVAPPTLTQKFGYRWWFVACVVCGDGKMCPASVDFARLPPEVPADWQRWREAPEDFEITPRPRV